MKRLVTAALLASAVAAHAGIPVVGGPLVDIEGLILAIREAEAAEGRIACEAIVCVSLISSPGPECGRSLNRVVRLDVAGRVAFLGKCGHAKWFDLNELAEPPAAGGPDPRAAKLQRGSR